MKTNTPYGVDLTTLRCGGCRIHAVLIPALVGLAVMVWAAPVRAQVQVVPDADASAEAAPELIETPLAEIDEPKHDFGEVWVNAQLSHTFTIRNAGTAPLRILRVKPGCGCTKAAAHPETIAPGESGEFSFTLSTKRMNGRFTKAISITTDDPKNRDIRLILTGQAKQFIAVEPNIAQFGRVKADSVITRTIALTNNTDKPLELAVAPNQNLGCFAAELVETVPDKRYELTVTAQPPYKTGINRVQLALTTNVPEQSKVDIVCMATLPQRLELRPPQIQLSPRARTQSTRKIWFTNNGDSDVHVTKVSATDSTLAVELQEIEPGRKYQFSVVLPAGYNPPADTAIVIETDDSQEAEIRLPIIAFTQPQRTRPRRPANELLGKAAPSRQVKTADGAALTIAGEQKKVQFLMFYASWCGFCKRALPKVEQLHQKYASNPAVEVIAINLDDRAGRRAKSEEESLAHYKQLELTMPLVLDSERVLGKAYKVQSFPTMFLVGKNGEVEAVHIGAAAEFEKTVAEEIDLLLAGKTRADFPGEKAKRVKAPAKPTRAGESIADEDDSAAG